MKRELEQHFGEDLIFTSSQGKDDVIALRGAHERLIRCLMDGEVPNSEEMKRKIVVLAARILSDDVQGVDNSDKVYPSIDKIDTVEKVSLASPIFCIVSCPKVNFKVIALQKEISNMIIAIIIIIITTMNRYNCLVFGVHAKINECLHA